MQREGIFSLFNKHLLSKTQCSFQVLKYASSISVSPSPCLMDDPVHITISGLEQKKIYTLHTSIRNQKGIPFASVAHYRSDKLGTIDLNKTPSRGGHFTGVLPMGPFIHLFPQGPEHRHCRVSVQDVTVPFDYQLSVYKNAVGFPLLTMGAQALGVKPVCSTSHKRHFLGEMCMRTPVRHGRVRGMLFIPPGEGPFPGVVDMYGAAGGLRELRSAMLAARGFAVLSLAFFAYEDLVPDLTHTLDTAYFQEAVDYLLAQDKVAKTGVGIIGISKAGDVILSAAVDIPQIKVVVPINGCLCNVHSPMLFKDGSVIQGLKFDSAKILILPDGSLNVVNMLYDPLECPETIIPIEKIGCKVLWVSSSDDKNWKSVRNMKVAQDYLKKHNPTALEHNWEFMVCSGAGHIIEPPFLPFTWASTHGLINDMVMWGGSAVLHSDAELKLWHRMQEVFRQELMPDSKNK
ncbi:BAAT/Acyl-CoA thioester hydrolase C-terminal [Trinorchestia longiramus]|nr:BAAT/Acyl-CoA thioester hydrolase C-terminal [Trinorchestia longiramus]